MSQPMHAVVHLAGGVTACHEAHLRYPVAHASNSPVKKQPCACHRAPRSESTADKPSETKAFPQPSSAPSLCGARFSENKWQDVRKDCTP